MQTKTHIELEAVVYYDFQPAELATQEYPGCAANIENIHVTLQDKNDGVRDITRQLSTEQIDAIWQHCMECEVKDPDHL